MPETIPPTLTDGSLYVFRIGYHLQGGATLVEEHRAVDLHAAIRHAQGRLIPNDRGIAASSDMILVTQGEGRLGAIPRSNVLYFSAEHVHADATESNGKYSSPGWKIIRPGQTRETVPVGTDRPAAPAPSDVTAPDTVESLGLIDREVRLGYSKGYERGINDIMARCEALLKETSVLHVLRRFAFARLQEKTALLERAEQEQGTPGT